MAPSLLVLLALAGKSATRAFTPFSPPISPSTQVESSRTRPSIRWKLLDAADGVGATPSLRGDEERPSVTERLDISDRFARWRFLQKLLDAEIESADANELLFRVLKSFLDFPRPDRVPDETYPGGTRENPSPKITPETRAIIESIFPIGVESGVCIVPALQDPECVPFDKDALEGVKRLLPDPREEEEAHISGWDIVMNLVGQETVKKGEQSGDEGWMARCSVARLLIHYDFLLDGVIEEPFE